MLLLFKNKVNKLIRLFDEPHEKIIFNIVMIFLFTFVYKAVSEIEEDSFSKKLTIGEAFYFSSITNFTLGFGDILPKSPTARLFVILHSLLFWTVAIA